MAGDYILAVVSQLIADIKHDDVTLVLSQVRHFWVICENLRKFLLISLV